MLPTGVVCPLPCQYHPPRSRTVHNTNTQLHTASHKTLVHLFPLDRRTLFVTTGPTICAFRAFLRLYSALSTPFRHTILFATVRRPSFASPSDPRFCVCSLCVHSSPHTCTFAFHRPASRGGCSPPCSSAVMKQATRSTCPDPVRDHAWPLVQKLAA